MCQSSFYVPWNNERIREWDGKYWSSLLKKKKKSWGWFFNIEYLNCEGNIWTAVEHIVTGVIGSGVLSLTWSMAQLGWIAGPLAMLFFALITFISTFLLCNCCWFPDPEYGPSRNRSYLEAVHMSLGKLLIHHC